MESRRKEPITTARVRVSCHERRGPRNQVTQLSRESNQPDVEQEDAGLQEECLPQTERLSYAFKCRERTHFYKDFGGTSDTRRKTKQIGKQ